MSPAERAEREGRRLPDEVRDELARLDGLVTRLAEALPRLVPSCDDLARMGVAGYLHSFYTGCEAVLSRIARAFDALPEGPRWHKELLVGAAAPIEGARPPVIRPSTAAALDALLGFRHFFRVQYGVELRIDELTRHALLASEAWPAFRADVERFLDLLEEAPPP